MGHLEELVGVDNAPAPLEDGNLPKKGRVSRHDKNKRSFKRAMHVVDLSR